MRHYTPIYQKQINTNRKDKIRDIKIKINELTSSLNADNELEESKVL